MKKYNFKDCFKKAKKGYSRTPGRVQAIHALMDEVIKNKIKNFTLNLEEVTNTKGDILIYAQTTVTVKTNKTHFQITHSQPQQDYFTQARLSDVINCIQIRFERIGLKAELIYWGDGSITDRRLKK